MSTAFKAADILIPQNVDMEKWAVVACDQYTGQPDYWKRVEETVGGADSTLKLILPEVYLEEPDSEARIEAIHDEMNRILGTDTLKEYKDSVIYIERVQSDGKIRQGLIGMIDLEEYDYRKGSTSQVRATEATVVERIPPRIKVRQGAPMELPHIMILIDDEEKTVVEPCSAIKNSGEAVYDFTLMENGGKICGYALDDALKTSVFNALDKLNDNDLFNKKYNLSGYPTLLYAMGDGNHSLATAKEFYEQLKRENPDKDLSAHPARYALVEIVNLHSPALEFEAIHRIVTNVNTDELMKEMTEALGLSEEKAEQGFDIILNGTEKTVYVHKPTSQLTVGSLQEFLDSYLKKTNAKIDYIHGIDVVKSLAEQKNSIGFILPDMLKSELFPTVIKDGALPRKTFSMGHAEDKRFYVECRKIK
ncbi:MAG: DUF1015 domain-containing protein [Ruminiclostridium sp.]|nr:DUF1015 domain-containing protein [Ruminiclostridium sp.]